MPIAGRILDLQGSDPVGDVAGAFRHIPFHGDAVGCFAGIVPELNVLVVNLSLPFGWTNSTAVLVGRPRYQVDSKLMVPQPSLV